MPVYEYQCSECDSVFELMNSIADYASKVICLNCPGTAERVFLTAPNITKLHDTSARNAELIRRSDQHSEKHREDNIERLESGERQGSFYSPETQKTILKKKGKKIQD